MHVPWLSDSINIASKCSYVRYLHNIHVKYFYPMFVYRLSKEAREMIDIGKAKKEPVVKTVSRPEENGLTSIGT